MTTPPRKTKLYRKRMWAVLHPQYLPSVHSSESTCKYLLHKCGSQHLGRVVRVEVRELPKAAGRGRGK